MTEQQLQQAIQMRLAGINYSIIASHFSICPTTLRRKLKDFDNEPTIHSAPETG